MSWVVVGTADTQLDRPTLRLSLKPRDNVARLLSEKTGHADF